MSSLSKHLIMNRFMSARILGVSIFLLAFVLRISFAFQWHALPYGEIPLWDAKGHDDLAIEILHGHVFQDTAFYASPLYPYFLALTYKLFGHSLLMVSIVNATVDSLTCALLGIIALDCFGPASAIITGLLAAFSRSMIFYTAPALKESLSLLILTTFTVLFLRALRRNKVYYFAACGACLGLCALLRGNALVLIPVVLGLIYIRRKGLLSPLTCATVFLATTFLAIAPATLHNYVTSHDFVLINYDDGFNFYLGNSPSATGVSYDFPAFINADPRPEEIVETKVAREAHGGKEMSPSAVSSYWRSQALSYILQNPIRTLSLLKTKFFAYWSSGQQYDNYDELFIERNFSTLLSWPLIPLGLIAPLAVFSLIAQWRSRRDEVIVLLAFIVSYMISVLLFYVTDRYRLPTLVFLLPLAGATVPTAIELTRAQYRIVPIAAAGALLMLGLTLWPRPTADLSAYDWGTLCSIETDLGQYELALHMIENGMKISPSEVGAGGMIKASYAEEQLGHSDLAQKWLMRAQQLNPENGAVTYNIGRLQAAQGHFAEALASFQQAIHQTPTYVLSYYGEAMVAEHMGQREQALAAIRQGLSIDSKDTRLLNLAEVFKARAPGVAP